MLVNDGYTYRDSIMIKHDDVVEVKYGTGRNLSYIQTENITEVDA
jgi:hypothetical protein